MAVGNSLATRKSTAGIQKQKNEVVFDVSGQQITLTPETVRNYLVSGDKERVTIPELVMFINLCKYAKLNPWLKEAYCIKYGNEPATMVVAKEAYLKRAESCNNYDGCTAGIVVLDENGTVTYREGMIVLPTETLVGGYAEVYSKDRNHPSRIEVSFEEYAGRKKDGSLNSQWAKRPASMIRKVAMAQALREAFPNSLGNLFTAEEQEEAIIPMDVVIEDASKNPEALPELEQPEPVPEPQQSTQQAATPQGAAAALFGNR